MSENLAGVGDTSIALQRIERSRRCQFERRDESVCADLAGDSRSPGVRRLSGLDEMNFQRRYVDECEVMPNGQVRSGFPWWSVARGKSTILWATVSHRLDLDGGPVLREV